MENKLNDAGSRGKILVAVSTFLVSGKLVEYAHNLSVQTGIPFVVLHVETSGSHSGKAGWELLSTIETAKRLGGEFLTTRDSDIAKGITRIARQINASMIVMGNVPAFKNRILQKVTRLNDTVVIHIINHPEFQEKTNRFARADTGIGPFYGYLLSLLAVSVVTILNTMLVPWTGYWTTALIYLLSVSLIALFITRLGAVLLAAASSALCLNFLFIPPVYTFTIGRIEDIFMFSLYFLISLIIGTLNSQLKAKERILRDREKGLTALYELTSMLNRVSGRDELMNGLSDYLRRHLGIDAIMATMEMIENKEYEKLSDAGFPMKRADEEALLNAYEKNISTGKMTEHHGDSSYFFTPVTVKSEILGILAVKLPGSEGIRPQTQLLLQNLLNSVSIALEREILAEKNRQGLLVSESEKLYKILFNLVSHELRTPITAITGASTSLLSRKIDSNRGTRHALIREILEAGERLNRTIDNLLNMGRLESGMLKLNKQLYDIRTMIDVSVQKFADEFENRTVKVSTPDNLPLISIDVHLIEQVINNMLANVISHTPPRTVLSITAINEGDYLMISFSDNGNGLKESEMPQIFNKFYLRLKGRSKGIGLGLTICKSIISAHNGRIEVMNNSEGGAEFRIYLPFETDKEKAQ
ncbi:MAG: DUF4118 domain-containing protein [Calditrichaeota bacterium]|nr:DUF4118 domain-containing protein [Calditrichota bacterium]